jgi:hypothetical protein
MTSPISSLTFHGPAFAINHRLARFALELRRYGA